MRFKWYSLIRFWRNRIKKDRVENVKYNLNIYFQYLYLQFSDICFMETIMSGSGQKDPDPKHWKMVDGIAHFIPGVTIIPLCLPAAVRWGSRCCCCCWDRWAGWWWRWSSCCCCWWWCCCSCCSYSCCSWLDWWQ